MFRNKKYKKLEHVNVLFDSYGFGDYIAFLPVIKYVRDHAPNIVQHVWVRDFFLDLAKNLVPGVIIKPLSKGEKEYNAKMAGVKLDWPNHTTLGTHTTDFGFHVLLDKQVESKFKNYCSLDTSKIDITKFNLPEKYVVLSTGFTSPVREMIPETANGIIDYCKSKGYEVVALGSTDAKSGVGANIKGFFNDKINFDDTICLVNQTSPTEAGKIIAGAKIIVGLDNALLHLAGCTEIPIVGGFTTVDPKHRMPYRHDELGWNYYPVEPNESLECRGCQSNFVHVYDHDFRECYYGDRLCVTQLTADKYIEQLEKIL